MTQEEFDKALELHHKFLHHLPGGMRADFTDMDLRGLELTRGSLAGANFERCNMSGMSLINKDFTNCNMAGSDLTNCRVNKAYFKNTNMYGTKLQGVNLDRVGLLQAVTGNGHEIKSLQVNNEFAVAYTAEHIWVGCDRMDIESWRKLDFTNPVIVQECVDRAEAQGGTDGVAYVKRYVVDHPGFLHNLITVVDPAVPTNAPPEPEE